MKSFFVYKEIRAIGHADWSSEPRAQRRKHWFPAAANSSNWNLFKPKGKTAMRTSILVGAIVACVLSAPIVSAQEKSAPAKPAMSMDMDKQMPQMLENMKKLQSQMEKIRKTTDAKERRKLLQEHMQTMQAGMSMMQSVGGPMMMRMLGDKPGTTDPKQQQEMMAWRMDMMQMMMEQVIQHDQMTESRPVK